MNMFSDAWAALSVVWKVVAFLSLQSVFFGFLINRFTRHSVALWVQQDQADGNVRYRFAVQNNEDLAFNGPGRLSITLEDRKATFVGDVRVYAGCKPLSARMNAQQTEWVLLFDSLPAYDSWTIVCNTNTSSDLTFKLTGESRPSHSIARLSATELSMLVGTDTSPDRLIACLAIAASEIAYATPVLAGWPYPSASWIDGLVAVGLAAFGVVVFFMISRKPQPVVQGYWKPSDVVDAPIESNLAAAARR